MITTSGFLWFLLCCGQVWSQLLCEWNTCHECILDPNICVWCSSEVFDTAEKRCLPASLVNTTWCPSGVQNPRSHVKPTKALEFSSDLGHSIQLKPQKLRLDLRVGEPQTFNFSYKAAENFPVDIYFLLDVSTSTYFFRDNLISQSRNIFDTMRNLTSDVRMGLGTFIEKNLLPFSIYIDDNNFAHNKTTYSFKHQLDLTDNPTDFDIMLRSLKFGGNYDNPESGFDGIAQVIACKSQIKWRDQSRKILVHITDEPFHSAGDGKFSGRLKPYDGQCYLDDEGFYTMEKEMDYPSVGIINMMATREQIALFFVSSHRHETVYNTLQSALSGSHYEKYSEKAISRRLKQIYESITQTVKLTVDMTSQQEEHLKITFEPDCGEFSFNRRDCSMSKGEEKRFTATIRLLKYFGTKQFYLGINPKGLRESISLDVNVIAECECNRTVLRNSTKCDYGGDFRCGVCECFKDKYGPTCNCSSSRSECQPSGMDKECTDPARGYCVCGTCTCYSGYGGKQCQYRTDNCMRGSNGQLCSGLNQGSCQDGVCHCNADYWTGAVCDCPLSKEACIKNNQECYNRGRCECGTCLCYALSKWDVRAYKDLYCRQTPYDSHKKQCRQLIPCIECLHKESWDACKDICGDNMHVVKQFQPEVSEEIKSNWNVCSNIRVDFGCYANFSYIYNDNNTITLFVLHERNCIESHILIGVISLVVLILIGLATLVAWKLLTDARDRREYEQFLKAAEGVEREEVNHVYMPPTTTYENPAFQKDFDKNDQDVWQDTDI